MRGGSTLAACDRDPDQFLGVTDKPEKTRTASTRGSAVQRVARLYARRVRMSATEDANRRLLRARDAVDRHFAEPLDVPALARVALMSPAHFIREFKATFGEPPHRYLQRRRVERAMTLLRNSTRSITEVGLAVGFTSPGTFSRTFKAVVGQSPSTFRASSRPLPAPDCIVRSWTRPATRSVGTVGSSSFGEATARVGV